MAIITGTSSDDNLTGTASDDLIRGLDGNDTLKGGLGNDTLIGGRGNDMLIFDAADTSVKGGAGTDTLKLTGGGITLDLRLIADTVYTDIEVINLRGSGNNTLTVAASDVLAISSTTDILRVEGNAGDALDADGGWTFVQNVTIGAQTYAQYTKDGATLRVDTDIDRGGIHVVVSDIALSSLNGSNGLKLSGASAHDYAGTAVSAAGDVNGDGFDDLIVGAPNAGGLGAGAAYVVFGAAGGFGSNLNLASLNGANGFKLSGVTAYDYAGTAVSAAGDVNGDGFDDLIVGATGDSVNGYNSGASYVVFGGDFTGAVTFLGTTGADTLTGTAAAETFVAAEGNDTITGGGGADVIRAGEGDDLIRVSSTAFSDVDGGSGIDALRLQGSGLTLDLTVLANNAISGIETINLTGSGNNTLSLAKGDLLDLSDTSNQLKVVGNAGDTVNLDGTWSTGPVVGAYQTYTQGVATILVDTDIGVVFI